MAHSIYSAIPNAITAIRLVLVPPIAFFIVEAEFLVALILFTISGLSDGLDGFLARLYGWESKFGRLVDPLADKLMMMATALALGLSGHLHTMLMALIITKDLVMFGGVLLYTAMAGFPEIQPNRLGKYTTAAQIVLLISVLLNLTFPGLLPGVLFDGWFWVVVIMTGLDGVIYLWIWTGRLAEDPRWPGAA